MRGAIVSATAAAVMAVVAAQPAYSQEDQRRSHLISVLESGDAAVGQFHSNYDFNFMRTTGTDSDLDYVIIDMEHHPFDVETLRQLLVNMRRPDGTYQVTPIVRIGANGSEVHMNRWMFKQVLDVGVFGIMVPFVNTAEEARDAVEAMRYPPAKDNPAQEPHGLRGWSPGTAAAAWGVSVDEYKDIADLWPLNPDGELLLAVQIETPEAIANLREILSVPGVGAAFIGPADLHAQMGYLGEGGVDEVEELIAEALSIAQELDVPIGLTPLGSTLDDRLEEGFRFMTR